MKARDEAFERFNADEGRNARGWTVREWGEFCLNEGFKTQKETTRYTYGQWFKTRIYPILGPIQLHELTVEQLQLFVNELERETPAIASRTLVALNAALTLAMKYGHIERHVGRLVKVSKPIHTQEDGDDESPSKRILTSEEQEKLLAAADGTDMFMPILLGLKFGLRFGECTGLKWQDLDFEKETLKVRRQCLRVFGKGKQLTTLKTPNSKRDLPFPPGILSILQEQRAKAHELGWEHVCPNSIGKPMTPQEGTVKFKRIAKLAGINGKEGLPDATHHDLRSTLLSYLANKANDGRGVRPSVLMRIAGHGKIDTTWRYYIRAAEEDIRDAMAFVA